MAVIDNRPSSDRLLRALAGTPGIDDVDPILLDELLAASAAWVEDAASTAFNGLRTVERRDGNGGSAMSTFRWPVTSVNEVKVELPVLALTRVYTADEVKVYRLQGRIQIFTYKLAAEHASLHLDRQIYGNIFPELPQCVYIDYTYGFPRYNPDLNQTSFDGVVWLAGDLREPREQIALTQLQQATISDAAASFLAQTAGLPVGLVQSVSFDGFSKGMNPQAYGAQVQAHVTRRDELMARRARRFWSTV